MTPTIKHEWFSNIRGDLLSGIVVALALIPEAIAFSIIAGVDPKVGLYASFSIAVVCAFAGGRSGMISAATGAMSLLMVTLVRDHGLQYLFAASVLTGVLQIAAGYLKLGNLMRFVSRSVVTGFVNALAILIFMAQLPELTHVTWHVYAMTAAGLGIIYLFPYLPVIGKSIPSPLVCILVLTCIAIFFDIPVRTVGDMGALPDALPVFLIPNIPFSLETLWIILPYSLPMAVVGLLESMMTATILDDLTDTSSDKNRECKGQGLANILTGFLGGMAGCAMIGQSVINHKSGGRGRLSTFIAGVLLLIMVVFCSDWIRQIPMAALVAVMIMVSIGTFSWRSILQLKNHPLSTNLVMLSTVAVVVATHNLAIGVLVGVILAALFFANKMCKMIHVEAKDLDDMQQRTLHINGHIFFASTDRFTNLVKSQMDSAHPNVILDLTQAHFWDLTSVGALDKLIFKLRDEQKHVQIIGMNAATSTVVERFGQHQKLDSVSSGSH